MNFCPNCGAKIPRPDQDQFCASCGQRLPMPQPALQEEPQPAAPAEERATPAADTASAAPKEGRTPDAQGTPLPAGEEKAGPASWNPTHEILGGDNATPPAETAGSTPGTPADPAPVPRQQTMPPAAQQDLLSLIDEVQAQPAAPASILPEVPAEAAEPAAAPASLFEDSPQGAKSAAEAPASLFEAGAPAVEDAPGNLFENAEAAPKAVDVFADAPPAGDGLFGGEAAAAAQAGAAAALFEPAAPPPQADLFAGAAPPPVEGAPFAGEAPAMAAQQQQAAQRHASARPGQRQQRPQGQGAQPQQAVPLGQQAAPQPQQAMPQQAVPQQAPPQQPPRPQLPVQPQAAPPRQPQRPMPPPVNLPEEAPVKRRSLGKTLLISFLMIILFAVVCAATILGLLYFQNRPAKVVDALLEAISSENVVTLGDLTKLEEGLAPTNEEWLAFCAAFEERTNQNELKSQLLLLAENPDTDRNTTAYPAVGIEATPIFSFLPFLNRYEITISSVSLLAPGAQPGSTVRLDMTDHTGTPVAEGEVYSGLMPGRYQYRLAAPGVDPGTIPSTTIEIFKVEGYNLPNTAQTGATVTISGCLSDDAVLFVNEQPVQSTPVNGVVTIENVPLPSVIRINATKDGATWEATVVFDNAEVTNLEFTNYVEKDGLTTPDSSAPPASSQAPQAALSEAEINTLISSVYASYLKAINDQDPAQLQGVTDSMKTSLTTRIQSDYNKANLFEFTSVTCNPLSITVKEVNGQQVIQFNGTFKYNYKPREGNDAYTAGQNYQSVELVLVNGQWLVNKMVIIEKDVFDGNKFADGF